MRRCPQCGRDYLDDTLSFCLDDGTSLLDGPASEDGPATEILPAAEPTSESATRTFEPDTAVTGESAPDERANVGGGFFDRKAMIIAGILVVGIAAAAVYWSYFRGTEERIESIAVMPLVNEGGNPDTEYLSDGLTEALIGSLSNIPGLNVKSRTAVFRYKGKETASKTIGTDLNVQALLNGRMQQRGDDLTLSFELINAKTENVIWSGSYQRKLAGILGLQDEIAKEVAEQLKQKLSGGEKQNEGSKSTENPEAYLLYLKGRYYTGRFTQDGLDTGLKFFNEAIAKDPTYANAYAGLAYSYISAAGWFLPSKEAFPKAEEAAKKALAIDPDQAAAQDFLAIVNWWYEWDVRAADAGFRRSIKLDPDDAHAISFYSFFLTTTGRFEEGIAQGKRAIEVDPLSPDSNTLFGQSLYFSRRYDEAEKQLRKAIEIDPGYWFAHSVLARTLTMKGRLKEALEEAEKAEEIEGRITEIRTVKAHILAALGEKDAAKEELEKVRSLRVVPQFNLAEAYSALGEKDLAFKALEQAVKDRSFFVTFLAREPFLDPLRDDPRFEGLLKEAGLRGSDE